MAAAQFVTVDPGETPVTARSSPSTGSSNCAAVAVVQAATAGSGPGLAVQSANSAAPAVTVRGPGTLLDLRDTNGASVLAVGQSGLGAVTAGAVTATSVASSGALTATTIGGTGDLTVTSGDLIANTAGKGLKVKEGSNARMGTLTLTGATPVVVATTAVTANSRIFLTTQSANGGTPTFCYISTRSAATSFTVQGVALDTSIVAWLIVEPA